VVSPYLDMVSAWYGAIRPGASAGDINDLVLNSTGGRVDGIALNPGHHIHVDEWVSSPFEQGSTIALASGMMLQMDIIPVIRDGGFGTNAEDGIILADGPLRDAIARAAPDLWAAITRRRKYMRESIGFELDDSVLPLSDIQGWLPPLLMAPGFAMTRVA
jgi:Xaa-Pro aminopeptidase